MPDLIDAPTGQRTEIRRNVLGLPLWMRRNGTQGATVVNYDAAGNVVWSASGLSLSTSNPAPIDRIGASPCSL